MTNQEWVRWSGLALLVASVLQVVSYAFYSGSAGRDTWTAVHVGLILSGLLMLFGLVGVYTRQIDEVGLLGMLGFAIAFIGAAIFVGLMIFEALAPAPVVTASDLADPATLFGRPGAAVYLLYGFVQSLGIILLGVRTMSAGVLPRWAAMLIVIGIVPAAFGLLLPTFLAWLGWLILNAGKAGLGHALWMDKGGS